MSREINPKHRPIVFEKYGGRCAYCGVKLTLSEFQVDHIDAKFRGSKQSEVSRIKGKDHLDNYNPSCRSCNASKSTFTLEDWRRELSFKVYRIQRESSQYRIAVRFGLIEEINKPVVFFFETFNKDSNGNW
jgi:hypothetical protein